jgi:hypothetical protein
MSQESKLCSLCVKESVECLVSQENHPGLAESIADVDLVAVVEDLDGSGSVAGNRPVKIASANYPC